MNGLSQIVMTLFTSGDAFFVGAALIVLGRAATWRFRQHRRAKWFRWLTILGVVLFALSMTPLPPWLYVMCAIAPLFGLNVPFHRGDDSGRSRIIRRAQPLVEVLLLAAVGFELIERQRLYVQPLERLPAEVHVIGDSLSAGIANEHDQLWPNLVAREWNVPLQNHAQPGVTTASAIRQTEAITCEGCVVLLEIGGNDFFEGRAASQIESDLDRLLSRLVSPRRTLILFELPLPPMPGAYDLARLQRRLAHRHGVRLISRRDFAKTLLTPGATTDGLHLSPIGHQAMTSLVLSTLSPRKSIQERQVEYAERRPIASRPKSGNFFRVLCIPPVRRCRRTRLWRSRRCRT